MGDKDVLKARERALLEKLEGPKLAKLFHETYERLAPSFGYETRKESAVPWEQVPEKNRSLMTAVCNEIARALIAEQREGK